MFPGTVWVIVMLLMVMFSRSWCYFHCVFWRRVQGEVTFWRQRSIATQQTPLAPSLLIHFDIASQSGSYCPLLPAVWRSPALWWDRTTIDNMRGTCSVRAIRWLPVLDSVWKRMSFHKFKYSICNFKQQATFHISHHVCNAFWEDSRCCLLSGVHGVWPFLA